MPEASWHTVRRSRPSQDVARLAAEIASSLHSGMSYKAEANTALDKALRTPTIDILASAIASAERVNFAETRLRPAKEKLAILNREKVAAEMEAQARSSSDRLQWERSIGSEALADPTREVYDSKGAAAASFFGTSEFATEVVTGGHTSSIVGISRLGVSAEDPRFSYAKASWQEEDWGGVVEACSCYIAIGERSQGVFVYLREVSLSIVLDSGLGPPNLQPDWGLRIVTCSLQAPPGDGSLHVICESMSGETVATISADRNGDVAWLRERVAAAMGLHTWNMQLVGLDADILEDHTALQDLRSR